MVNTLGLFENEAVYKKVMTQLSLVSAMYEGQALPLLSDPDEETKEPELLINLSKATFAQEEMLQYNYAGND